MQKIEISEQAVWNKLPLAQRPSIFLQSWEWGLFQIALGRDVQRIAFGDSGVPLVQGQWIRMRFPFGGSYWYCPRGPVVDLSLSGSAYAEAMIEYLRETKRMLAGNSIFLKIEPQLELCNEAQWKLVTHELGLLHVGSMQPQDTRLLDLSQGEDRLLSAMHQKTRYNIKVAERKGVAVASGASYLDDFLRLAKVTSARDGFSLHAPSYYETMVKQLSPHVLTVSVAEYEASVIAANIMIRFGNAVTYLHGASASEQRQVMAPYILHWKEIQSAAQQGVRWYDWWGIAPQNAQSDKSKKWEGITRFKNGFGGIEKNYVGAFDLICNPFWYKLYRVARNLRNR